MYSKSIIASMCVLTQNSIILYCSRTYPCSPHGGIFGLNPSSPLEIRVLVHTFLGSCLLLVVSVDTSADTSVDMSVESRSTRGRLSIDGRSIVDRHIDRLMTDTRSRVDRLSTDVATDCRSIFRCRFATKYWSYVGGISVKCRSYIGKLSVIYRPTVGRVSRVDLNVLEV